MENSKSDRAVRIYEAAEREALENIRTALVSVAFEAAAIIVVVLVTWALVVSIGNFWF